MQTRFKVQQSAGDDNRVNALLVEYQIHGSELAKRLEIQDRQITFLQGYAIAVGGAITALYTQQCFVDKLNLKTYSPATLIVSLLLLVALAITLHLGSAMTSASYMFMVLRRRMAEIENRLNQLLRIKNLLRYEEIIAKNFFEQSCLADDTINPTFASALVTYSIIFLISVLLASVAVIVLPPAVALAYTVTAVYWYVFLVHKAIAILGKKGQLKLDKGYRNPTALTNKTLASAPILSAVKGWGLFIGVALWAFYGFPVPPLAVEGHTIFLYTLLTGTIVPLPSEAPVLFVQSISDWGILLYAAAGKMVAAFAILLVGRTTLIGKWPLQYSKLLTRLIKAAGAAPQSWLLYLVCQAVPFMPMRASTIVMGSITSGVLSAFLVTIICGIGTIIRMLLMLVLLNYGMMSVKHFFG